MKLSGWVMVLAVAAWPAAAADDAPTPTAAAPAGDGAKSPAAGTLRVTQTPEMIEKFLLYYLDMYTKHLKSPDWMARCMAVISLARIDDPRNTEQLMRVMQFDKETIVRIYAWEALHGRQDRLTPDERARWVREAFRLASGGHLRGELRLALVGLIEEGGPTAENKQLIKRIFAETSAINPSDIRTLWALGDMIKRWRSGDLVRWLIESMKRLDDAYRAELILRRIHDGIEPHRKLLMESSQVMWGTTYQRWMKWFKDQHFKEMLRHECPKYTGRSAIMPPGEVITDTADPRWRQDLELPRFHLDQLDIGFALDTTASMSRPLEWIKRDVVKMMWMFELISREPRIGVVLYRDHGDEFVTRAIPLTDNAKALQQRLIPERPKGGGDVPEAVYDALAEMVHRQPWSPSPKARKVIIVMGDAPPRQESLDKIKQLAESSVESGFSLHTIKVRTSKYVERALKLPNYDKEMTTFDRIAEWGQGTSVWVQFWTQSSSGRWQGTARPADHNTPQRVIFRQVLRAVLEKGYQDRVDPFIGVLLEYIERPIKETRVPFPKATPGRPGRPRDPQMNR